jgi:Fe(3+) dicitrate transport protein
MKKLVLLACALGWVLPGVAQLDTTSTLKELLIIAVFPQDVGRMGEVEGATIFSGKKNEVLFPLKGSADLSVNMNRQVYSRIPGIMVWESDGSGIQTSIATRGLSPNRSWEFNMRQDGVDIASDPLGYPEAYYTPPTEAVDRIEVIRGASALSYGPQFGGMVNYVMRKGSKEGLFHPEIRQTIGSYGLSNTFISMGGASSKFSYFSYIHHRTASGWRENSAYQTYGGHINFQWRITSTLEWHTEYTHNDYSSQQPGGLTDALYEENWRQSSRERNWMGTPWNVFSTGVKKRFQNRDVLDVKLFGLLSERNSVGFTSAITTADSSHFNRTVDRDAYTNWGIEARYRHDFTLAENVNTLTAGARWFTGQTDRKQRGKGTAADDFDLTLVDPTWGRDLEFTTQNVAVFSEVLIRLGDKWRITPGLRWEQVSNAAAGQVISGASTIDVDQSSGRQFLLYGVGGEYKGATWFNVYANYSRAYRPVMFSDLTPSATTDVIDPNLKDANGYNADFGVRGLLGSFLNYDVSAFYMMYNDRIGRVTDGGVVHVRNVGASEAKGVEVYADCDVLMAGLNTGRYGKLKMFVSSAFIDATYIEWNNPAAESNASLDFTGNRVEYAPQQIHRAGLNYSYRNVRLNWQWSGTSSVYTDANNTEEASANAQSGKIDGYQLHDVSVSFTKDEYRISLGANNVFDERYATRRAGGYPGPGLLPGQGRTVYLSVVVGL